MLLMTVAVLGCLVVGGGREEEWAMQSRRQKEINITTWLFRVSSNYLQFSKKISSNLRVPNTPISASPLDQYLHQSQYSLTTASYPYNNAVDQWPHPGTYQSHSHNHSQVKNECLTPPIPTAYSSQTNLSSGTYSSGLSSSNYPSSYSMETSSPHPPMQSHVNPQAMSLKPSISTPSTPLSYLHPNSGQSSHYYPQDHLMAVIRWQSPNQCSAQQQNPKTVSSAMSVTATWPKRLQCDSPRGSAILCTETSKTNKGVVIDVKTQVRWVWQVSGWWCDVTDGSEKCIELLRRDNAADVGEYSCISKMAQDELKRWQERIVEG